MMGILAACGLERIIIPTSNSYFKIIFDSSGSMNGTLPRLERDLKGVGVSNPYTDKTCLKSYLQDFFATGGTEASGNTNTATNGSDDYDAKVSIVLNSTERIFAQLGNEGLGFSSTYFPGADSVAILTFLDEVSSMSIPENSYTVSSGLPNTTSMTDLTTLKSDISSFNNTYRGIYFFVDVDNGGDGKGAMQTLYDALNNTTGSRYAIESNNLSNQTSSILIGNPSSGNLFGHDLVEDGNYLHGYYTKLVIDALINSNYDIDPYIGVAYPTSETKVPTNHTPTTLQLNGIINHYGDTTLTERGFIYKTTSDPSMEIGDSGVTKVVVSGLDTSVYNYNLSRTVDIYYRAYGINSNGTGYGEMIFSDKDDDFESPTTPTNLLVTSVTNTSFNLYWTASTDNFAVTGYVVRVELDDGEGLGTGTFVANDFPTGTTSTISGLTANTFYNIGVLAHDAAGNNSSYGYSSVTTSEIDTTPPTVPTNLDSIYSSSLQTIDLSWTASTDNVGVTAYSIERKTGSGLWSLHDNVGNITHYSDALILSNTSYSYRVRAMDAANNFSAYSNITSETVPAGGGLESE